LVADETVAMFLYFFVLLKSLEDAEAAGEANAAFFFSDFSFAAFDT
jgi:hypothetical protein